jgi:AcrR family transcriptional regulator
VPPAGAEQGEALKAGSAPSAKLGAEMAAVAPATSRGAEVMESFLDAAERLLIKSGHAGVTTRRLAEEAGANHGLIHYYFGSLDELMLQVLERFVARLVERQREMYAADVPFIEKWRTAMGFMEEDLASGYPKVSAELQALAWNRPELRERLTRVHAEWYAVLMEAFSVAYEEYRLEDAPLSVEAMVALVMTFNEGMLIERLSSISRGHRALLADIDAWLESLEGRKEAKS